MVNNNRISVRLSQKPRQVVPGAKGSTRSKAASRASASLNTAGRSTSTNSNASGRSRPLSSTSPTSAEEKNRVARAKEARRRDLQEQQAQASRDENTRMRDRNHEDEEEEQDTPTVGQKRQRISSADNEDDDDDGGLANAPNQNQHRSHSNEPAGGSPLASRHGSPAESQAGNAAGEDDDGGRHRPRRRQFDEEDRNEDEEDGEDNFLDFGYGGGDDDEEQEGNDADSEDGSDIFTRKEVIVTEGKKNKKKSGRSEEPETSKVVEQDFPSQLLPFAKKSKAHFRKRAAFGSAFPPRGLLERETYIYNLLMDAAKDDEETSDLSISLLKQVSADYPSLYSRLATFAVYGKRQLLNSLIGKAQQIVEMYFGLPGDQNASSIRSKVAFLLEKGVFRYGGVDTKERTFDAQAPCATPLVSTIVRSQWFDGTKGDRPAYWEIIKMKIIPKETLTLCFTVIECILKCWQGGAFTRVHFSEDNCSARYQFFLETWNSLETKAPQYAQRILKENFQRTLKQTKNASLLYTEGDVAADSEGTDFAALNDKAGEEALIS